MSPPPTTQTGELPQTPAGPETLNLGLGQPSPSLLPLPLVHEAAMRRLGPGADPLVLQYGSIHGPLSFREGLAALMSERHRSATRPEQLLVTGGISSALAFVSQLFATPGQTVVCSDPTYFLARGIFESQGLPVVGVPVDEHGLQVERLEQHLEDGLRPGFVYCMPSFHNPTGVELAPARARRLVELAERYDFVVVADEPYLMLGFGDAPPPSLSDDVVILGNTAPAGGAFKVAAKVTINLGGAFYVNALGLDTRLAGELQIVARNGLAPSATGQISTVGGVFEGYGQKLEIERGLVSFQGPLERPALNIVALRKGLEVEAGVAITGTARRPQVRLVSEPSVPDPAKLSWIVLGRAPDESNGADLALLIPAAQALLGGTGGGISSQLAGSLGLDQISVGQGDLNSVSRGATSSVVDSGTRVSADGSVSGQVVTLGKRLSAEAFISFEQSLVGAASIVKLSYQLSRRVSVVARGGTDNAVDMYYTFVFR